MCNEQSKMRSGSGTKTTDFLKCCHLESRITRENEDKLFNTSTGHYSTTTQVIYFGNYYY